jgi:hypothetical protein
MYRIFVKKKVGFNQYTGCHPGYDIPLTYALKFLWTYAHKLRKRIHAAVM